MTLLCVPWMSVVVSYLMFIVSMCGRNVDGQDEQLVGERKSRDVVRFCARAGEMSMGMTNSLSASGSHMDRVGVIHEDHVDRESASHRALAGESLTGSLSGSTIGTRSVSRQH